VPNALAYNKKSQITIGKIFVTVQLRADARAVKLFTIVINV